MHSPCVGRGSISPCVSPAPLPTAAARFSGLGALKPGSSTRRLISSTSSAQRRTIVASKRSFSTAAPPARLLTDCRISEPGTGCLAARLPARRSAQATPRDRAFPLNGELDRPCRRAYAPCISSRPACVDSRSAGPCRALLPHRACQSSPAPAYSPQAAPSSPSTPAICTVTTFVEKRPDGSSAGEQCSVVQVSDAAPRTDPRGLDIRIVGRFVEHTEDVGQPARGRRGQRQPVALPPEESITHQRDLCRGRLKTGTRQITGHMLAAAEASRHIPNRADRLR